MFELIFGWRKASKCKKLIRKVQCRLKLLKNKRCCIVRQLRDDVAQLIRHGHHQTAFNRVEQIFMDECIVTVYDLLDHFCEFIIIHISYIRRHKDCPNDINEAMSSLIFASARCGDLPELRMIRKLFEERYGQLFSSTALDLLPGNLVNNQIRENLCIKLVPNDVKYKLVDEIARSCLQTGPLALEYSSELHQQQANKSMDDEILSDDQIPSADTEISHSRGENHQQQASNMVEAEGKIVLVDMSSERKKLEGQIWGNEKQGQINSNVRIKEKDIDEECSSGNSSNALEEIIYLDDIEEFQSPMTEDEKGQDQRLFFFRSCVVPARKKYKVGQWNDSGIKNYGAWDEKEVPRRSRKGRKISAQRLRKRTVSLETNTGVNDVECAIYYNSTSRHWRVYRKNMQNKDCPRLYPARERVEQSSVIKKRNELIKGMFTCNCSLENTCYLCISDSENDLKSSRWDSKKGIVNFKEEKIEHEMYHVICPDDHLSLPVKQSQTFKLEASPLERKGAHPPYVRAMTMPYEPPKESCVDNIERSNSFPFQEPSHFNNGSSSCSPHVHPMLPDYDELAAKFMALKKANLQNKQQ